MCSSDLSFDPDVRVLVLADGATERRVRVKRIDVEGAPRDGEPRRYEVLSIEPPQESEPTWVFELLEPDSALIWSGQTLAHPDRAVLAALGAGLDESPPDVENVVASLPRLVRQESRARILDRAARLEGLVPGQLDALLDAALATNESGVGARTTSGRAAGGEQGSARHALLEALAARADLGEKRARRIASSLSLLTYSWWRNDVLRPLVPLLSTKAVIAASDCLSADERHGVIERLAKERGDRRDDALEIAATLASLQYTWWRNDILGRLVPVLTTPEILKLSDLLGADERHQLIERLVKERGEKRDEALLLLATCPSLSYSWWRNDIMLSLLPALTTKELIAAADELLSQDERHGLISRLVKERGKTVDEAHLLCAAAGSYPYTWWKNEVFNALFDLLETKELIDLAGQLSDDERHALVLRLVKARGQDRADARLLRDAAASFPYTWWKNEVYGALFPVLTTRELLDLTRQLGHDEASALVLRLAKERGGAAEDAGLIAKASAALDYSWTRLELLETLLEKDAISTSALLAQTPNLSADDLYKFLGKVAPARRGKKAAADKIAAATSSLQLDAYKAELLLQLVGYASKDAIVAASREIHDAGERTKVLEALVKVREKNEKDEMKE